MNNKFVGLFLFTAGAIIGSAVTWKFLKTKYEQIAQEEIDSVKEAFSRRMNDKQKFHTETKPNLQELADQVKFLKYEADSCSSLTSKEVPGVKKDPYIIEPGEFGEADGYDVISLNYYADGVLTDGFDVPIEDVESVVGLDSLTHFGEYEDDSVYVRNDELKADYEILLDMRKFSDVANKDPHLAEEE